MGVGVVACASGNTNLAAPPDRPARDTPARFVLDMDMAGAPPDTIAGSACRSPLFDPRDGARILMQRSSASRADYAVPAGRYGVAANELLRVMCNTGEPIGIVRR